MHKILIGLGSNVGNRQAFLLQAVEKLKKHLRDVQLSKIYETAPWGKTNQASFLNMCISGNSDAEPLELLKTVKAIEQEIGRIPTEVWGPREIDIDILAYGDLILNTDDLQIPHLYLAERKFVLVPLSDIAADWQHPVLNKSINTLTKEVKDDNPVNEFTKL